MLNQFQESIQTHGEMQPFLDILSKYQQFSESVISKFLRERPVELRLFNRLIGSMQTAVERAMKQSHKQTLNQNAKVKILEAELAEYKRIDAWKKNTNLYL